MAVLHQPCWRARGGTLLGLLAVHTQSSPRAAAKSARSAHHWRCRSFTAILPPPHRLVDWLGKGEVQKLVLVITGVESRDVLERWVFNIETDRAALAPGYVARAGPHRAGTGK